MIPERIPAEPSKVEVEPRWVKVAFSEEADALAIKAPPLAEETEMERVGRSNFSIWAHLDRLGRSEIVSTEERMRMLSRMDRFGDSPVYWNRLADAKLAHEGLRPTDCLRKAASLSDEPYYRLRLAEALLSEGQREEAEKEFSDPQLDHEIHALLRRAFFRLENYDFTAAAVLVDAGLALDPADYNARLFRGALCLVTGDYQRAALCFKAAIGERSTSSIAHANLGYTYWLMGQRKQAFFTLRKAVALDPFNRNALILLADVALFTQQDQAVIEPLLRYVEFEQTHADIWARLARAFFQTKDFVRCIAGLKRQGSIEKDSVEVWNNLGAAYLATKQQKEARECFRKALALEPRTESPHEVLMPTHNMLSLMFRTMPTEKVFYAAEAIVLADTAGHIHRDRILADISAIYVGTAFRLKKYDVALLVSEKLLADPNSNAALKAWLAAQLLSYYTLTGQMDRVRQLVASFSWWMSNRRKEDRRLKSVLLNNIAYAIALDGDLPRAEYVLSHISDSIHVEPYPTATLGYIHMKKGHLARGTALYSEAIGLAQDLTDKARLRQKLQLETAIAISADQPSRARRLLDRVVKVDRSDDLVTLQAQHQLKLLAH